MTEHLNALPPGYRLQEYEVVRVLGVGGFGITYLAFDNNLDQARAIKEYLPNDIAIRLGNNTVQCKATESRGDFDSGLQSFLDEAKRLARFKHDNIVKVHRSFSENGTAYIVMEYAEGETLASVLEQRGKLSEKELKDILYPILAGLEEVHKVLIHRDIKPGNIIIKDIDESPVLIDFGSARQAVSSKSRSMTAIVSAGYAPIEQYSTQGNQGPWTDIYALGCLCYRALTATPPQEAPLRIRNDPVVPLSTLCKGKADPKFLAAIDWALKVYEEERPQSIADWRRALLGGDVAIASTPPPKPGRQPLQPARSSSLRGPIAALAVIVLASVLAWTFDLVDFGQATSAPTRPEVTEAPYEPATLVEVPPSPAVEDEPAPAPEPAPAVVNTEPQAPDVEPEPAEEVPVPEEPEPQAPAITVANARGAPAVSDAGAEFHDELASGGYGPMMVTVPSGEFTMGTSAGTGDSDEAPAHTVRIERPIAFSKYEITFDEYQTYMTVAGLTPSGAMTGIRGDLPASGLTWTDAASYAIWLSQQTGMHYRLPSEAEWEYASQAGGATEYPWGDSFGQGFANCRGCGPGTGQILGVGTFRPNAFGLHDMQGNVWEWVQDCARDSYAGAPSDGHEWPGDAACSRVLRGGAFDSDPALLRSRFRNWRQDGDTDGTIGFRLVRDIE